MPSPDGPRLPADLLNAIAQPGGGRVVLVVGAGCSFEPPTSLPLARTCAEEAHRRLVEDGVLVDGECTDSTDLSRVADAVFAKTGAQSELVERLPRPEFKLAKPNEGCLAAAAMLRERAISCVLTLNLDLSMTHALVAVGAQQDVAIIEGPQDHGRQGAINLVYLHRNANAADNDWILRTVSLENEWREGWEEVVANRFIGAPVTVFAGLGSRAAVLLASVAKVRTAVPGGAAVYQVDPGPHGGSDFSSALALPPEAHIRLGWCDFIHELARRLVTEHVRELESECERFVTREHIEREDIPSLCGRLSALGLLKLGALRASWLLGETYAPRSDLSTGMLADLLLTVGLVERTLAAQAALDGSGLVRLTRGATLIGTIAMASGRGQRGWLALEVELKAYARRSWRGRPDAVGVALVQGVGPRPAEVSNPEDIVGGSAGEEDIVAGVGQLLMHSTDEVRSDPSILRGIFGDGAVG